MKNPYYKFILKIAFCFIFTNIQASSELEIVPLWSIEKTFQLPESATYDPNRNRIYISNIVHYKKDASGFISSIDSDGKNLKLKWITGLNSPTGLAIHQDKLYAVDMDALIIIDLIKQKIIHRIPAPKSEKAPLLNDIAIAANGDVYISGSASRKLYKLEEDQLIVLIDDSIRLLKANSVLVDGDDLIVGGQYWNRFSRKNASVIEKSPKPAPSSNLVDFDGITHDGNGGYFVTVINDPRIWHININGKTTPLSEKEIQGIDIHFDIDSHQLFVPQVRGGLTVFSVKPIY